MSDFQAKMHQIVCRLWSSAPDPTGGYSARPDLKFQSRSGELKALPQTPIGGFRRLTSMGGKKRGD